MLSGGVTVTAVTSFSATPEIVSVPDAPKNSGGADTAVAAAASATLNAGDAAKAATGAGGVALCRTMPSGCVTNGPTDTGGGGVALCSTPPSAGAAIGVIVGPAAVVSVSVFSGASVAEEVPAGVVTVTARGPVAAPAS